MRRVAALLVAGIVLALDLVTKALAFRFLEGKDLAPGEVHWIAGDWFGFARVMNEGVTGGMLSGVGPTLLTIVTGAAVVGIALYLFLPKHQGAFVCVALGLVLGGAVGNLVDRILYGAVRDFIDVWPRLDWFSWVYHWPTFNIADAAIVCGVILLLFHSLFLSDRPTTMGSPESP